MEGSLQALPFLSVNPPCRILFAKIQLISELSQIFTKTFSYPPFSSVKKSKGCQFSPAALAFPMLIHSKRSHRSIAKIEGTLINTEHIIYSFSVSATIAWLSIYRRAAGPAPSSKKLSRITSRHTTVVKWGRRILRRNSGTCPSSGWLFLKHAVRFFSATQWRIFIEIGRHAVRSGLSSWMRKTCFQAAMLASMSIGCNP